VARLHLVRHGRAAAGWEDDHDPGLDALGRHQAELAAARLAPLGPLPLVCSPLRRTQETAEPLAALWATPPTIDDRVAEIPSPTDDLAERGAWLRGALAGTWTDLGADHVAWRERLLGALAGIEQETVVVSHFVAINAVIGAATGDDRLVVMAVGNASVTVVDHDGSAFHLVSAPDVESTEVM